MDASDQMLVGELASQANLSPATINFYVQQGLLPRPRKVNRTRAYYDRRHLDRLAIIKRLQAVHGLPLSLIRRILEQADDEERLLGRLAEQRGPAFAYDLLQLPADASTDRPRLSRADLKRESGLSESHLRRLEDRGLLKARGERELFGAPELEAARAFRRLFELGADDEELALYCEYLALQRRLAGRLYQHLLRDHRDAWLAQRLSGRELSEISGTVEAYVRFRAAADLFPEALQQLVPKGQISTTTPRSLPNTAAPGRELPGRRSRLPALRSVDSPEKEQS